MDSAAQAEGEKRVKTVLIEPLERLGLAKPSTLTKAGYEAMVIELCQKLAYMHPLNLAALAEQVAGNPAGKDRDRIPIANTILAWAAAIEPPRDGASPLIRAVFGHTIGQSALAEGWAPELLRYLKQTRRWPGAYVYSDLKAKADGSVRQFQRLNTADEAGEVLSSEETAWLRERRAILARCQEIAQLAAAA